MAFSVRHLKDEGQWVIYDGGGSHLTQASKTLSKDVVRRMLWFVEEFTKRLNCEDDSRPARLLLACFSGANKAIVHMQLDRLAAQRLME
jgi:hypothetical protein